VTAPLPPPNIAARKPQLITLTPGALLHRFYTATREPIHFDASRGARLNAPDGTYGVLYAAETVNGAFAETFLRSPGRQQLPADLVAAKAYLRLRARRSLKFIRLAGTGLAPLGATAEVTHGGLPYDAPQAWSAALHAHAVNADGIAYTARHDDSAVCLAVFERAHDSVEEAYRNSHLDADWFWRIAEQYQVGLAPS
jgi:hypothetical protein